MQSGKSISITQQKLEDLLTSVCDPEIPVLTIADLGILRSVRYEEGEWIITITPTYSGCPAMNMIEAEIRMTLDHAGIQDYRIKSVLDPPWTTDWITAEAHQKMKDYGIAPPQPGRHQAKLFDEGVEIQCPHCGSVNTEMISNFGSTACKALYRCHDCKEPFDYFKCH